MVREDKREKERDILFDTDISRRNCRLVIYIPANRSATASDINSLAPVTSGVACPNLSENKSRGNSGRDMRKGEGREQLALSCRRH